MHFQKMKSFLKKNFPSIFFFTKKIKQYLSRLWLVLKELLNFFLIKVFNIEINYESGPLINVNRLLSINMCGINNKITLLYKKRIYNNFKIYNLNSLNRNQKTIIKNIVDLKNKTRLPLNILESFLYNQKELSITKFKKTNGKLLKQKKIIDYHSKKNLFIDGNLGFFHFYLQIIPIIIKNSINKKFNIIIGQTNFKYYHQLLFFFLKKKFNSCLDVNIENNTYKLKHESIYPYKKNLFLLKKKIQQNINFKKKLRSNIYIPRNKNDDGRIIYQEKKIIQFLVNEFQFEIFEPHKWTFRQQLQKFNSSKIIISPHGAALSNIIASRDDCTIIELNKDSDVRWHYSKIASDLGMHNNYHLILGEKFKDKFIYFNYDQITKKITEIIRG